MSLIKSFENQSKNLTAGQQKLVGRLDEFFAHSTCHVFLLKGYAGTGKTYITSGITKYLVEQKREFHLVSPTGKAAKVISQKTGHPASTIHRLIYKYSQTATEEDENNELSSSTQKNADEDNSVYIVDEASMLSNSKTIASRFNGGSGKLLDDLIEYFEFDNFKHRKVIFIGDNAQLQPVGMNYSPALSMEYIQENYGLNCLQFELTDVVRQGGKSGVLTNANQIRDALTARDFSELKIDFSDSEVKSILDRDIVTAYLKVRSDSAVIIAYTNAQVASYNCAIRRAIFSDSYNPLLDGEQVICVSNIYKGASLITNGQIGKIKSVIGRPEIKTVNLKKNKGKKRYFKNVDLVFQDVEIFFPDIGLEFTTKVIINLLDSSSPNLSKDENDAIFADFRSRFLKRKKESKAKLNFKNAMMNDPYMNAMRLKYGYAITCHKSQGSEWQHVFVNCLAGKFQCESYFRWLYTAITRTSDKLYLAYAPSFSQKINM